MKKGLVLTTAYFPPVSYFSEIIKSPELFIEAHENYSRQTFRNRCYILSGNGKLALSIPIINNSGSKQLITDVKIDYTTNWQRIHSHAIRSAYGKSPFYHYYKDIILESITNPKTESLFELNHSILTSILQLLKIKSAINFTPTFHTIYSSDFKDLRNSINPKRKDSTSENKKYIQTFSDRFDFVTNLSIIDLIFNTGPDATNYLQ